MYVMCIRADSSNKLSGGGGGEVSGFVTGL